MHCNGFNASYQSKLPMKSYSLDTIFGNVCYKLMTSNEEIWPWVKVMTHLCVMGMEFLFLWSIITIQGSNLEKWIYSLDMTWTDRQPDRWAGRQTGGLLNCFFFGRAQSHDMAPTETRMKDKIPPPPLRQPIQTHQVIRANHFTDGQSDSSIILPPNFVAGGIMS